MVATIVINVVLAAAIIFVVVAPLVWAILTQSRDAGHGHVVSRRSGIDRRRTIDQPAVSARAFAARDDRRRAARRRGDGLTAGAR
jgi:hypothetical protein